MDEKTQNTALEFLKENDKKERRRWFAACGDGFYGCWCVCVCSVSILKRFSFGGSFMELKAVQKKKLNRVFFFQKERVRYLWKIM